MILNTTRRDDMWYATVTDENRRLVACGFYNDKKMAIESAVNCIPPSLRRDVTISPEPAEVADFLHEIYMGRDPDHSPSVAFLTKSAFVRRVYDATIRIPKGKVTTYGRLAKVAGSKRSSRAVGNAMAGNPLPLMVPCHRVVRSTLKVGKYGGGEVKDAGSRIKRELLAREGVRFNGDRVSEDCVWSPAQPSSSE